MAEPFYTSNNLNADRLKTDRRFLILAETGFLQY